jgi:Peptidase S24-like
MVADVLRDRVGVRRSVRLQVRGESMLPALWPGDIVEIVNCSLADVQPGEIVLALRDGRLFLHRLLSSAAPNGFQLRGDSMPGPDPVFPKPALLGRLVSDSRNLCSASRVSRTVSRALGFLLCHCSPARRLALTLDRRRKESQSAFRNSDGSAELETLR